MPIQIELRHGAMGVVYHCHGVMSILDFYAAGEGFLLNPDEIGKWRYSLIDLTNVESMDIKYDNVAFIVPQNERIASHAVRGVLLAVASPKDIGFGLSRMWEMLVEAVGWETKTFRAVTEAEGWIEERLKQKFGIDLAGVSTND